MNIDNLKTAWHASIAAPPGDNRIESLTRQAQARAERCQREARLRIAFGAAAFLLALGMLATVGLLPGVWLGMRIAILLWALALIACVFGLWPLRAPRPAGDAPVKIHIASSLERLRREIAYQHSLRWRFWLPFTLGLGCALAQRVSPRPDITWLLALFGLIGCAWGFVHGPRHWPDRLRVEETALRAMLADLQTSAGTSA